MTQTYVYFILVLLAWGLWGFTGKYGLKFIDARDFIIFNLIGSIIIELIVIIYLFLSRNKVKTNTTGLTLAIVTGILAVIGAIIFYFTLSKAKASIVVPLTSLYPVVTVLLSFIFLKERVTLMQGIGIVLAIIAGILLSI